MLLKKSFPHYYPLHWHNYFEIEVITKGIGKHIYNGAEYEISERDVYLLTPIDFHEMAAADSLELINISFDAVYLPESMFDFLSSPNIVKRFRLGQGEYERFIMAAKLLAYECETQGACISQLLEYLLNFFLRHEPHQTQKFFNNEHLSGIKKAISYIEMHFREKISLNQIADLSGYNPTYFSELFRKVTGETYIERLKTLRINYARMLLANGLSVSDACFASGFGSLSNFLTAFKEKCGMPPGEYRKKLNNRILTIIIW